jgi:hypothetical protein
VPLGREIVLQAQAIVVFIQIVVTQMDRSAADDDLQFLGASWKSRY